MMSGLSGEQQIAATADVQPLLDDGAIGDECCMVTRDGWKCTLREASDDSV